MPKVAVVTDSTASLPAELLAEHGISVVPLQVVIGDHSYEDGVDAGASPERVAAAMREATAVSTSRPTPARVLEVYRAAAALGAEEVVSVHLSAEVSATWESAVLAAQRSPVPVHTVDSRLVGPGTGYAALTAAAVVAADGTAEEAADAARARAAAATTLFYADSLDHLRRGGRVGAAAALLGSALAVKPVLEVRDGKVVPREKVRTSGRALTKLGELAVEAAGEQPVDVAVCHLANPGPAAALAAVLAERLEANLGGRVVHVSEIGAVLGAHVGPGLVGVTVAPRLTGVPGS
ncbi:MAG: DegV family protein [uncultured Nocardioidaceae bacterium]|uniref:DegV family protein n=1 Tax=uncultured Nocardioidaceae bacterium TaxID=253824 RepID=A0A6J4KVK3_9ACTN|nr:MAG: DegV family protein [uncultured Nocardioidaceae bacterium]